MAINKELYERYKAMKAAKLAQSEQNADTTEQVLPKESGFRSLSSTQQLEQNNNIESYSCAFSNTAANFESVKQNYSSQFTGLNQVSKVSNSSAYNENIEPYRGNVDNSFQTDINEPSIQKYALIGYPLGHSLSEYIHMAGFRSIGINAKYELIETPPENLSDTVKYLKSNGYRGFNVTIPLKLPVAMFLDEIDASANTVNAINTVMIDPKTKFLKGYNTDAEGFRKAIPSDFSLCGKTAGILGTGGAGRAAICALAQSKVKEIKLYTRNVANCIELLEYLRKTYQGIEFNAYQIDRIRDLSDINILVNATPIGMQGLSADYTPVEEPEILTLPADALVYDVIYNPKKTKFIKIAQRHNYKTVTGMDMLIYQALEAQKIWTGRIPDFKDMKIAALENI